MATDTCTIQYADGHLCGKPGVVSFRSRFSGRTFVECAEHNATPKAHHADGIAIGDIVHLSAYGVRRTGRVVSIGRTNAKVDVFVGTGSKRHVKTITRPLADLVAQGGS